jgi:pyridoxamine 5'-phosphate oxidase family protein
MFTEKELAYIRSQPLARLATVSGNQQPDAAAVGFQFDRDHFYVGGASLPATRKYKNIRGGNVKVALLIDDLVTVQPWNPRGIRVYGTAQIVERQGMFGPGAYFRITPLVSWSWNIEVPTFANGQFVTNKTVHQP